MMETRAPVPRRAVRAGGMSPGTRMLPAEVAVALSYNGSTHAVMMATPADLEDFARGFTLTEGIASLAEIESIEPQETPRGIDLQIWLGSDAAERQARRRRSMAGPVGCGLCGIDSLEEAVRRPRPLPPDGFTMTAGQVQAAMAELEAHQPLHDATRAAHCAALWRPGGILAAREDVGRHNALDKLIGAVGPRNDGAVILTCRVSIDMVQKACAAGFPVMIAVSAPTAAAVAMADAAGLTLIGLARPDSFEIFTHPDRIPPEEAANVA
ncbi:formate dehydrogenase accessory sulfurtransferase FdhD [Gemmobacter serpentinus]|uniref:formate dehydrogenase accessory sulfurtransferase FdhD n=1 Tax=Gemmobacter serpentinus TaxID=2652247 RepID=UPI00124E5E13|nr:formate dehydrogenase accessory sulfurtransferase FdhD [Gemmobacter serpentinus]